VARECGDPRHGPDGLVSSLRLRCKIPHGPRYWERVAAVERTADLIRNTRACFLRVLPAEGGVFCDLYLHGTQPPDAGIEFALKATGEAFKLQIIR
jgi:hypothetical protein